MRTTAPRSALLIGNFLSSKSYSRGFIEELTARLTGSGWTCSYASSVVWRPLRLADMVQQTLRSVRRVSVVHVPVYSGRAFIWAEVIAWLTGIAGTPLVLSLHGGNLPDFSKRYPRRTRNLLRRATTVICPSGYLQETMRPFCDEIRVVPNPVDLRQYEFMERDSLKPRLVWLRSFHAIYNPALAPRVLALVRQKYSEATLTMFGFDRRDGSRQETMRVATELGVSDAVHFAGGVDKTDVPTALQTGDIFINTTNIDNAPVSVLEAMACGLPVVSTRVGGIPYLLINEQDALLVPPDDPIAMANAVVRLLSQPELARRLSRAGRAKAETLDWPSILLRWDEILVQASMRRQRFSALTVS